MKHILILITVIMMLLITFLFAFWFVSPAGQVSALQSENTMLKTQLAASQSTNTENVVAIAVLGMFSVTALLLFAFFMVLCLLGNIRPSEFFRSQHRPTQRITQDNTETRQAIEHSNTDQFRYVETDQYMIEV
jgi:beta-lactamase regulating signal transducer with metallopeptidase domain